LSHNIFYILDMRAMHATNGPEGWRASSKQTTTTHGQFSYENLCIKAD